jgi:basic amino acid/polyamine antiporter, APA family
VAEMDVTRGEMRRSLTLTGVTVNAMALIAPGAFLWTTFQAQSALNRGTTSTAPEMWTGLLFTLVLALLTAYSYAELARLYPGAGTGSTYYFAEAAFLDKERPQHQRYARTAKLSIGWISHLYYWIYPGIMIAFIATLFDYIYLSLFHHQLTGIPTAAIGVIFAFIVGYISYRGIMGSTMVAIAINVIQIVTLVGMSIYMIGYRLGNPHGAYEAVNAAHVIIPHSFISLLYQSTIAILLLVGFESITALGAEAINPEKDIKRGVLLSLIIQGGVCYMFEYFAANYSIGAKTIHFAVTSGATKTIETGYAAAADSSQTGAPIGNMLNNMTGHLTVPVIVAVTVLLALIGTTLACLNTGVRVTYSMAKDKEMPALLGFLHGRFATPHAAVWILTGLSAAIGAFASVPWQSHNLTQVTVASNTGTFLVYGATCFIALVAFASRHDKHVLKHIVLPGIGGLMNLAELFGVLYIGFHQGGLTGKDYEKALFVVFGWVILGIIWVTLNPHKHHAKGVVDAKVDAKKDTVPASVPG